MDYKSVKLHDSQTLCTQLWNHVVVDIPKRRIRACCKTPSVLVSSKDITEFKEDIFLNYQPFKQSRKEMLQGEKPASCLTCWNLESAGNFSFRNGPKQWHDYFQKLDYSDYSRSENPDNLDIQLDNYCDLKCLYCDPEFSSQWQAEKQKFGDIKNYISIDPDYREFEELFFKWFSTKKEGFRRIAFLGGEPLISPRFYDYLDRILNTYNDLFPEQLEINIITNLNTTPNYLKRFVDTINRYKDKIKFNINVSMEAYGEQAEAIRQGVDFERFKSNFDTLAQISGIVLSTITTVNIFSLSTLHLYLQFLLDLEQKYKIKIIFYPNLVSYPEHLQINLIPKELGSKFVDQACAVLVGTEHDNYLDFLNTLYDQFDFSPQSAQHIRLLKELSILETRRNVNYKRIFHDYKYLWE